jgi:hypothetical protein
MITALQKNKGSHDIGYPYLNNTTNACTKQRFGRTKFKEQMQDIYISLLDDVAFIRNALYNPRNLPKDMPALIKLVELLKRKYDDFAKSPYGDVALFHINNLEEELADMRIKFYKYYFRDKEKPVTIEALNKQAANFAMEQLMPQLEPKGYKIQNIVDVRVEEPIAGVSTKKHQGKEFIWTSEGWIEKREG